MKDKPAEKVKKTVQFNPTVPEFTVPKLPVSFHSKKKNEEIVLKRLRNLVVDREPTHSSLERGGASSKSRDSLSDDETKVILDRDFIIDCLCWHNEYRARHRATALTVSHELCEKAQRWADRLAAANEFYYRINERTLGQNLFCCPANNLLTDLTGQEVAAYWYKEVKKYDFFKDPSLLHTNVNTGHFTQMVWAATRYFGAGKSFTSSGKMFVVAFYFPCGNIVDKYQMNVLPPILEPEESEDNNSAPA